LPRPRKLRVRVSPTTYTRAGKTIHRRGYSYERRDVGASGRGPKVIPELKEGGLGGEGYFRLSAKGRHARLGESVARDGYRSTLGKVRALEELFKRTKPSYARTAARDRKWLVEKYGGSWD
jgi:hypothetical protein